MVLKIKAKIDIIDYPKLNKCGLESLKNALGVVGAIRFLEMYDNGGKGDCTAEKYNESDLNEEDIRKMFL